ncbi:putative periplasmic serine endoprotease DegP-like [Candidatus Accumulibacter aalborgensis]|uniref:Probable periplasmic serine endoprotease DegP-like n=1 Tax=Candidatus Accumulibacter aalborgensis TaxID=1860102 RepID=A0A1A8XRW4_9PROT|nr:DegQ family serine endoprotease [Candidatus Accumulibacter aalborgensis]SBT07431.1 putative periplasmic serine endoprotease DegP-like [Candidatus Accumulibacter aalborgensis]
MPGNAFKSSLLAVAAVAALGVGYAKFGGSAISPADAVAAVAAPALAAPTVRAPTVLPDFSAIVERAGPAVVNISVSGPSKTATSIDPNDPRFEFFRHFGIPSPRDGAPAHGMGSGFIVSEDGLILTNAHVVDGADEVTVKLTDKREFKAKVVGLDKVTDVAVLRIQATNLPVVRLGDPSRARVGEWVLAIGSPFGFENSVTAGIVSAKSRSLASDSYVPFIQTDVAVNPGNSGGPLLNMDGEAIGINSQIYSRSGGYQGVSFAIPIDVAINVQEQLVQHGKVSHGRLGVTIQEVSQSLAASFGLKGSAGALISSVEKGSPAAAAGLEAGDIILKLNDTEIGRSSDLPPMIAAMKPGTKVKLQIWRKGASQEVALSVGEIPAARLASSRSGEADKSRLGLALRSLTPQERGQAENPDGLLVESATGPAARAGIQPGDIIVSLNGQPVRDVSQLRALLDKAGKSVALLIERDNARIFVPVELG